MTAVGKKRCVPTSWKHVSPKPAEVTYVEGDSKEVWGLNLVPPMGWTCNDGTTNDVWV
jgi:hypothetical protein